MTSRKIGLGALLIAAVATLVLITSVVDVNAWPAGETPAAKPAAKEVALAGRVVDLHCYMTGQMPSADAAKCTADCIRAGVPAGLETDDGLIVLGQGANGPAKTLLPFAYHEVEVRGKLFEKDGMKYLDISSVHEAEVTVEE